MATIEPRLIHLLNESTTTPKPYNAELPPIKSLNYPQNSSRPHPIEPGAGQRSDKIDATGGPLASQSIPPLYSITEEALTAPSSRKEVPGYTTTDRPFSTHVSSQDLRMILEIHQPTMSKMSQPRSVRSRKIFLNYHSLSRNRKQLPTCFLP
ncbi:hypothetical protein RRF57_011511 [Xylaria bambusicola]|uniref:Uncharacterized protein n=1 Tax=Xylaria bambusicola TaxID=326684 RepID=A0AAN7UWV5_9PEZI